MYSDEFELEKWPPPPEYRTSVFGIYENLNATVPAITERNILFAPEPCAPGTIDSECLTSYICRLALVHSVSVKRLISELVRRSRDLKSMRKANLMNDKRCQECLKAFQILTGRNDLHFLTVEAFEEKRCFLGAGSSMRKQKAWCIDCYREDYLLGKPVYDRLYWCFSDVTNCLHHKRLLAEICYICSSMIPFISNNSRPGYCSKCKNSLFLRPRDDYFRWTLDKLRNEQPNLRPEQYAEILGFDTQRFRAKFPYLYGRLRNRAGKEANASQKGSSMPDSTDQFTP